MAECSIAHHRQRSGDSASNGRRGTKGEHYKRTKTSADVGSASGGGGGGGGGGGDGPDAAAGGGGGGGHGPLPWTSVGKGQHRRVLLRGNSSAGVNAARGYDATGPGGTAIPPLDEDGGVEMNGSAAAAAAGGGRARRVRGCSLAHASRCLHNVLYLCAANAKVRERGGWGGGGSARR